MHACKPISHPVLLLNASWPNMDTRLLAACSDIQPQHLSDTVKQQEYKSTVDTTTICVKTTQKRAVLAVVEHSQQTVKCQRKRLCQSTACSWLEVLSFCAAQSAVGPQSVLSLRCQSRQRQRPPPHASSCAFSSSHQSPHPHPLPQLRQMPPGACGACACACAPVPPNKHSQQSAIALNTRSHLQGDTDMHSCIEGFPKKRLRLSASI